jgi:hypothetical protein
MTKWKSISTINDSEILTLNKTWDAIWLLTDAALRNPTELKVRFILGTISEAILDITRSRPDA